MKYRIIHKTQYIYQEFASLSYNEARLLPSTFTLPTFEQTCLESDLIVIPTNNEQRERIDFFGNRVVCFTLRQPHEEATITATSLVEIRPQKPNFKATPAWETVQKQLQTELTLLDARQYLLNSPLISVFSALADYARPSFPAGRPVFEAVYDLMHRIHTEFDFMPGVTTIATPLTEVLQKRRGVCQDFAQLMIGCLRAQGLAARYVSGYIETLPPPGQERLQGADASHAWCAVYLPNIGWVDFDPTNDLVPQHQHVVVGWGRDYSDISPFKGVFFSNGSHKLLVSVDVERQPE